MAVPHSHARTVPKRAQLDVGRIRHAKIRQGWIVRNDDVRLNCDGRHRRLQFGSDYSRLHPGWNFPLDGIYLVRASAPTTRRHSSLWGREFRWYINLGYVLFGFVHDVDDLSHAQEK